MQRRSYRGKRRPPKLPFFPFRGRKRGFLGRSRVVTRGAGSDPSEGQNYRNLGDFCPWRDLFPQSRNLSL